MVMSKALEDGYALGYFESWNLESLQGVLDAAEVTRSPMVIGFNGDFLSRGDRGGLLERLDCYSALARAAASRVDVPCLSIFNECPNDGWVRQAILGGFDIVMPADSTVSIKVHQERVAALTRFAHANEVAVEAEIDELPCGETGAIEGSGQLTDPEVASRFVEATQIDLLAVSVGNVHIQVSGEQGLDLGRLEQIRRRVSVPLVLHGGTGITRDAIKDAVQLGVSKVNYGTYLKQRYITAMRAAFNNDELNPHELLGIGGSHDVMMIGRRAVRDAVLERIETLGCEGRA
jgi:fructose-bisphosphate aldolase, class II